MTVLVVGIDQAKSVMGFNHQVEMKLDQQSLPEPLHKIESWCADWQLGSRVL
ncbi:hypothetical protein [Bosea vaviloviae]|uniref:hypothetical protein n=1 Tax=Bosea vaviloviae TaxID=1526658 RepID=UPI001314829C|nr:hypothetical protein [Bosea vaviloviae]